LSGRSGEPLVHGGSRRLSTRAGLRLAGIVARGDATRVHRGRPRPQAPRRWGHRGEVRAASSAL